MTWLRWVVAVLACLGTASASQQVPPPIAVGRALVISDIHFDPLADPAIVKQLFAAPVTRWPTVLQQSTKRSLSGYGSDTNHPLLQSTLAAARAAGPYAFVVYTGDALRHDFDMAFEAAGGSSSQFPAFARKTQAFVIDRLQTTFGVPVLLALGNDDSDCGDYALAPSSPYLAAAAQQLSAIARFPAARKSFASGGYYAIPHPVSPKETVIVLNSVFWSPNYASCKATPGDPGAIEIAWFDAQLAAARAAGRRVTLVMHVPPGMDAYGSSRQGNCAAVPLIEPRYAASLAPLLERYGDMIVMAFAGHTHMDDFRLPATIAAGKTSAIPVRVTPSVSPLFANNPGFSILTFDPANAAPYDLSVFSLSLGTATPVWAREYRFTAAYGVPAFDLGGVRAAVAAIATGGKAFATFTAQYAAGAASPITPINKSYFTCAQTASTPAAYQACVCSTRSTGGTAQ